MQVGGWAKHFLEAQSLELAKSGRGWEGRLHRGGGLELKLEGSVAICWGGRLEREHKTAFLVKGGPLGRHE